MQTNIQEISNISNNNSEMSGIKRVAIYARVSTTEQAEEGYSIDEQTRILNEWCNDNGYIVYKEYVDRGISGKSIAARPALQQLLMDAKKKEFDIVVVWKMNRLARNILDLLKIVNLLEQKNIAFKSFSERYETATPSGKLQFHMMAAIAEFERGNIAENVKMGMLARAKEGSWNGGQVLGYDTVEISGENKKRRHTKLVINQNEAQTVRRIFELYIQGHGYKSIANRINKEGHRSKKGNLFSINTIKTILTNPVYIGFIRYNVRRDWNSKRRNNINPDPVLVKGHHEPIISNEVWEKTQSLLKKRSNRPNRIHSGEFPLTGLLKCPVCGAGMVLGRTTNRNKDGSKRVLEYYVCGAWKNKGTAACNSNGVRTKYADEYVINKIASLANSDKLIMDVVSSINAGTNQKNVPLQKEYESLKKLLKSVQVKRDRIFGLYEEGLIEKVELSERLEKLNEEKRLLEDRLAPLELELGKSINNEVTFDMVKEVMRNFVSSYKTSITTEQKKQLLSLLVKQITIGRDRKIESIQIQLNNDVVRHFTKTGEEKLSGDDDFSSPFYVSFAI
ncbi:recombinase family protein [Caldibacillus thermoamylovorans]|uniref:recombinase family protein n=1 Tax=Caldibacillus thermoamylovorans TaxID=35841 RepID=UPI002041E4CD|nr:recombinase family protein [Caldibacillus thermoamylovorans]MCM3478948.1 recombinase family protein [Caldibacillus thermoamylovorans]